MSEGRTKERVARTAWWPRLEKEVSEYINTCERCQKANRKHGKKYGLLQHIKEPKHPWENIKMVSQGLLWKQEDLELRNQELTWKASKDRRITKIDFFKEEE
ncbi:hypothetical protein O181_093112 [Austropuccinia psidii MF-1]|uniref:Integrase zinc-binding domain-containing protein n=1 Tax=Austropuccinia psidii MF-1 TaxID=1389203 RepID=A0A9Q3J0U8_9BASI|nr:hypothetical protein [Austropuccinia psidii MF-1]